MKSNEALQQNIQERHDPLFIVFKKQMRQAYGRFT